MLRVLVETGMPLSVACVKFEITVGHGSKLMHYTPASVTFLAWRSAWEHHRMSSPSPIITDAHQAAFIKALAQLGIVTAAAKAAGVCRMTVYRWREDPEFAKAWDDALEQAADQDRSRGHRRAVDGVEEPIYQGGQLVGSRIVYSDSLLGKLLGANRPQKFRERYDVAQSGNLAGDGHERRA
jgi:hypothetical protein